MSGYPLRTSTPVNRLPAGPAALPKGWPSNRPAMREALAQLDRDVALLVGWSRVLGAGVKIQRRLFELRRRRAILAGLEAKPRAFVAEHDLLREDLRGVWRDLLARSYHRR